MQLTVKDSPYIHIAAREMGFDNPRKTVCLMEEKDTGGPFKRATGKATCPFCIRDAIRL